jgi:hypothetical protein
MKSTQSRVRAHYRAHVTEGYGDACIMLVPAKTVDILVRDGMSLQHAIKIVAEMEHGVRGEDVYKTDTAHYAADGREFTREHELIARAWADFERLAGKQVQPGRLTVYVNNDTVDLQPEAVIVRVDSTVDNSDIVNWQDTWLDPTYGCTIVHDPLNEVPAGATSAFMDGRSYCLDPEEPKKDTSRGTIICSQETADARAEHRCMLPAEKHEHCIVEIQATPWLNHKDVEKWLRSGKCATWYNPLLKPGEQTAYRDVFTTWDHGEGPDSPDNGGDCMPQWLWDNIEKAINQATRRDPKNIYCIVRLLDSEA